MCTNAHGISLFLILSSAERIPDLNRLEHYRKERSKISHRNYPKAVPFYCYCTWKCNNKLEICEVPELILTTINAK